MSKGIFRGLPSRTHVPRTLLLAALALVLPEFTVFLALLTLALFLLRTFPPSLRTLSKYFIFIKILSIYLLIFDFF